MMRHHYFTYFLLGCVLVFVFPACENDLEAVRGIGYFQEVPTEVVYDVEMLYSDSAQVRVIVRTPELHRFGGQDAREEFRGSIKVDFLGEKKTVTSRLTAKGAVKKLMMVKNKDGRMVRESVIIVKDSVVLVSGGGDIMETDELLWYEDAGRMSTDKWVRIKADGKDIFGFGFESDKDFKNWVIHSVVGEFKTQELLRD